MDMYRGNSGNGQRPMPQQQGNGGYDPHMAPGYTNHNNYNHQQGMAPMPQHNGQHMNRGPNMAPNPQGYTRQPSGNPPQMANSRMQPMPSGIARPMNLASPQNGSMMGNPSNGNRAPSPMVRPPSGSQIPNGPSNTSSSGIPSVMSPNHEVAQLRGRVGSLEEQVYLLKQQSRLLMTFMQTADEQITSLKQQVSQQQQLITKLSASNAHGPSNDASTGQSRYSPFPQHPSPLEAASSQVALDAGDTQKRVPSAGRRAPAQSQGAAAAQQGYADAQGDYAAETPGRDTARRAAAVKKPVAARPAAQASAKKPEWRGVMDDGDTDAAVEEAPAPVASARAAVKKPIARRPVGTRPPNGAATPTGASAGAGTGGYGAAASPTPTNEYNPSNYDDAYSAHPNSNGAGASAARGGAAPPNMSRAPSKPLTKQPPPTAAPPRVPTQSHAIPSAHGAGAGKYADEAYDDGYGHADDDGGYGGEYDDEESKDMGGGGDDEYAVNEPLEECPHCQRRMRVSALKTHVAKKVCQKQRKVFDVRKMRVQGVLSDTEIKKLQRQEAAEARKQARSDALAQAKKDWRAKHEEFQNAIKAGRQVAQAIKAGVDLRTIPVRQTAPQHDDRVQCPHCSRKFADQVAERHIPHCKNTVNKPAPPPGSRAGGAGAGMGGMGMGMGTGTGMGATRGPAPRGGLGMTRKR